MIKPRVSTGVAILALLWPEFVAVKGCVFLKSVMLSSMDTRFPTRTGFDENHVHLLDHFTHGARMRREPFFDSQHPDFVAVSALGRDVLLLVEGRCSEALS